MEEINMINEQDPMYVTKVNIEKILNAINTKNAEHNQI